MGYLNDPAASEQLWAGGYLHTGDVATWDPDGVIRLVRPDERHHQERRRVVLLHSGGGHHLGEERGPESGGHRRQGRQLGRAPMALVVVEPGFEGGSAEGAQQAIRAHVQTYVDKGVISKFAVPDRVEVVKELPLTSVGKVDKIALRDRHLRDEAE